jgi:hypothetical protein
MSDCVRMMNAQCCCLKAGEGEVLFCTNAEARCIPHDCGLSFSWADRVPAVNSWSSGLYDAANSCVKSLRWRTQHGIELRQVGLPYGSSDGKHTVGKVYAIPRPIIVRTILTQQDIPSLGNWCVEGRRQATMRPVVKPLGSGSRSVCASTSASEYRQPSTANSFSPRGDFTSPLPFQFQHDAYARALSDIERKCRDWVSLTGSALTPCRMAFRTFSRFKVEVNLTIIMCCSCPSSCQPWVAFLVFHAFA